MPDSLTLFRSCLPSRCFFSCPALICPATRIDLQFELISCAVLWQSCNLINDSCMRFQLLPTDHRTREKIECQRQRERERERSLHCSVRLFSICHSTNQKLSHILHSLYSICHSIYQSEKLGDSNATH